MRAIEIPGIVSLHSAGDRERLDPRMAVELQNMRPVDPGLLQKTKGFGAKISTAAGAAAKALHTYIHDELSGDEVYLLVTVQSYVVTIYYWTGSAWSNLTNLLDDNYGTIYADDAYLVFVQDGRILRLYPGAVSKPDGSNVANPIWIGYINDTYFDGLWTPTPDFHGYDASVVPPDTSIISAATADSDVAVLTNTLFTSGPTYYYWLTSIYDDLSESLPSDYIRKTLPYNFGFLNLNWTIPHSTTFCKRVIGYKVYRAATTDGVKKEIGHINLLRPTEQASYFEGSDSYYGKYGLYVPALSTYHFIGQHSITGVVSASNYWKIAGDYTDVFSAGKTNKQFTISGNTDAANNGVYTWTGSTYDSGTDTTTITINPAVKAINSDTADGQIDAASYQIETNASADVQTIDNPVSGGVADGYELFELSSGTVTGNGFDDDWELWENSAGSMVKVASDVVDGAYYGDDVVISFNDYDTVSLVGSYVISYSSGVSSAEIREVLANELKAVQFDGSALAGSGFTANIVIMRPENGMFAYMYLSGGPTFLISFLDIDIADGDNYPLAGVESIRANGKYSVMIGQRLVIANVVADPDDTAEVHPDWVMYSEENQPDVIPYSNALAIRDREGGEITGLHALFGPGYARWIVLKKQGVFVVDPDNMTVSESKANIGNIAERGSISAGDNIFIVNYDGIYMFTPNSLAESAQTPTDRLKISDPIDDMIRSFTQDQLEGTTSIYDQDKGEVIFNIPGYEEI